MSSVYVAGGLQAAGRPGGLKPAGYVLALVAIFAFRLWHGLSLPFWSEDERQVYLIGLRSFARGEWPYFGADVVWNGSQLPGALQALLVEWPLRLWPAPEAPFVLLNIVSFAALTLFAWYLSRRFPDVPRWLVAGLVFTCPWTLNFSAHVINTSYILPGAILFFVGFLEAMPAFRRQILPVALAWAGMGAGLLWMMQIHMSWVVLPPFVVAAAIRGFSARAALGFLAGAALPAMLLIPTLQQHGISAIGLTGAISWQWQSPLGLVTTAARVLSFSSFELWRFLGLTRADRVVVLWREFWILPFAALVVVAGLVQPIWMLVTAFRRARGDAKEWKNLRVLFVSTIVLIWASYFLSIRGQQAHAFYLAFPISAVFAIACWQAFARDADNGGRLRWERVAWAVLVANIFVHVGLAHDRWSRTSIYTNRDLVAAAIADRNDRYLGDRRDTIYATEDHRPRPIDPVSDPDAYLAAKATDDLKVEDSDWSPVGIPLLGSTLVFAVTVSNSSRQVAWLDLRFEVTFKGADGRQVATHDGVIKHVIQPGETRRFSDLPSGMIPGEARTASFRLTGAERAIPRK